MKVALTVGDFLERGALAYPDRVAVVDEPGVPGSLGRVTYDELQRRARGMAAVLAHGDPDLAWAESVALAEVK